MTSKGHVARYTPREDTGSETTLEARNGWFEKG